MKEQIEKQAIEEMARMLSEDCGSCNNCNEVGSTQDGVNCTNYYHARKLYNAGYHRQKRGKWEKRVFIIFDSEKVGYNCSECNTTWDNETKCCPNCGANMEGTNDGRAD